MCKHENFHANVAVNRLEDSGKFIADVTITCAQCKMPFQFLGIDPGLKMNGASCSIDGLEGRFAIAPQDAQPNPLQRMMHAQSYNS